jgi:hypothetical protein
MCWLGTPSAHLRDCVMCRRQCANNCCPRRTECWVPTCPKEIPPKLLWELNRASEMRIYGCRSSINICINVRPVMKQTQFSAAVKRLSRVAIDTNVDCSVPKLASYLDPSLTGKKWLVYRSVTQIWISTAFQGFPSQSANLLACVFRIGMNWTFNMPVQQTKSLSNPKVYCCCSRKPIKNRVHFNLSSWGGGGGG